MLASFFTKWDEGKQTCKLRVHSLNTGLTELLLYKKVINSVFIFFSLFNKYLPRTLGHVVEQKQTWSLSSWSWQSGTWNTLTHQKGTNDILHLPWPVFSVPAKVPFDQGLEWVEGSRTNTKVQQFRRELGPEHKSHITIFRSLSLAEVGEKFFFHQGWNTLSDCMCNSTQMPCLGFIPVWQ